MMSTNRLHPRVPVGECTEKISTCTPATAFKSDYFDYIDIGAVDRTTKSVTGTSRTIGTEAPSRARQVVHSGDVLVSTVRPNLNAVARVEDHHHKAVASTGFCVLRPKAGILNSRYLFHWVKSEGFINDMVARATGANYPAVSDKTVKTALISLPSMSEQERIADTLDKADALRRKDQELLQKYDKLAHSLFDGIFGDPVRNEKGWKVLKLGDVSSVQIGPFGSLLHVHDYIQGGIPLVNPTHIINGLIVENDDYTVSSEKHAELQNYHLATGDVVMGRRGEMGRCAIVNERENGWLCGTGSLVVKPTERMSSSLVFKILSHPSTKRELEKKAMGTTMMNLNQKIVSNLEVIVPARAVQSTFEKSLQSIDRQRELTKVNTRKSSYLFDSLLADYFS